MYLAKIWTALHHNKRAHHYSSSYLFRGSKRIDMCRRTTVASTAENKGQKVGHLSKMYNFRMHSAHFWTGYHQLKQYFQYSCFKYDLFRKQIDIFVVEFQVYFFNIHEDFSIYIIHFPIFVNNCKRFINLALIGSLMRGRGCRLVQKSLAAN